MNPSRNDSETTCPVCRGSFQPVRRQRYCTAACRQAAWRSRSNSAGVTAGTSILPVGGRRDHTVYACGECEQRYLGQQWCEDCVRPCTRVGLGGLCPCCDEPITIDDLIPSRHDDLTGHPVREYPAST